jgi:hypothetical protein
MKSPIFTPFVVGLLLLTAKPAQAATDFFGSTQAKGASLIGIFYDLKQDQKGNPKKNTPYSAVITQFINQGWDEAVLNQYYRASTPLYTTQIFIPYIDAKSAPSAFNVEDRVKPSQWVIHYKGQVSSSVAGTFRFLGLSDDLLIVAVNGKTVLIAPHPNGKYPGIDWKPTEGPATSAPSGPIKFGTWFTVAKDEVIDLDVLIGEWPGGGFAAWLQFEQQGVTYEADVPKHTKFPVFQLEQRELNPNIYKWGKVPMFSTPPPIWKAIP